MPPWLDPSGRVVQDASVYAPTLQHATAPMSAKCKRMSVFIVRNRNTQNDTIAEAKIIKKARILGGSQVVNMLERKSELQHTFTGSRVPLPGGCRGRNRKRLAGRQLASSTVRRWYVELSRGRGPVSPVVSEVSRPRVFQCWTMTNSRGLTSCRSLFSPPGPRTSWGSLCRAT